MQGFLRVRERLRSRFSALLALALALAVLVPASAATAVPSVLELTSPTVLKNSAVAPQDVELPLTTSGGDGEVTLRLVSHPDGVSLVGTTLRWDGRNSGTAVVEAVDDALVPVQHQIELRLLQRLAFPNMSVTAVHGTAFSQTFTVPGGSDPGVRYRIVGGAGLSVTGGGPGFTVSGTLSAPVAPIVEAYVLQGGVELSLGSAPLSVALLPPVVLPTIPPVVPPTIPPVIVPTIPPVVLPTIPPVVPPTIPPVIVPTFTPTAPPTTAPPTTAPSSTAPSAVPPVARPGAGLTRARAGHDVGTQVVLSDDPSVTDVTWDVPSWLSVSWTRSGSSTVVALRGYPPVVGVFLLSFTLHGDEGTQTVSTRTLEVTTAPIGRITAVAPDAELPGAGGELTFRVRFEDAATGAPTDVTGLEASDFWVLGLRYGRVDRITGAGSEYDVFVTGRPSDDSTVTLVLPENAAVDGGGVPSGSTEASQRVRHVGVPRLTHPTWVDGEVGTEVRIPLRAETKATDPTIEWSLENAPSWLSLRGGELVGRPTEVTFATVTVVARDVYGQETRGTVTVTANVRPNLVRPTFTGTPPTSVGAVLGEPVAVTFTAAGDPVPLFWIEPVVEETGAPTSAGRVARVAPPVVHTAGLPEGVTLTDHRDGTATLAGTPTSPGEWVFDVVASSAIGRTAHRVRLAVAAVTPPPTTAPPTEEPTETPTEEPTDGPTPSDPTPTPSDDPTASPTAGPDDDALPVTGAESIVGIGLAALFVAVGIVVLAVRRRAA